MFSCCFPFYSKLKKLMNSKNCFELNGFILFCHKVSHLTDKSNRTVNRISNSFSFSFLEGTLKLEDIWLQYSSADEKSFNWCKRIRRAFSCSLICKKIYKKKINIKDDLIFPWNWKNLFGSAKTWISTILRFCCASCLFLLTY